MPSLTQPGKTFFPLLAEPQRYVACSVDLTPPSAAAQRAYWLKLFRDHLVKLLEEARTEAADRGETAQRIEERVEQARRDFLNYLATVEAEPAKFGRLDINAICHARQAALIRSGLNDPYRLTKQRENELALRMLPGVLAELDALTEDERLVRLFEGVFAGNIFDLGAVATLALFEQGSVDFRAVRAKLKPRPWFFDHLDAFLARLRGKPGCKSAVMLVDNAGPDVVLGMIPLARELVSRGAHVILAANSLPALNDITHPELTDLLRQAAGADPLIRQALADGRLEAIPSGNGSPLIDLRHVSDELAQAVIQRRCDLLILQGMGRAIETNFEARFRVDALKLAMIKDPGVARSIGARMYDLVCRFDPANADI
ncbi:MAG: DUF89 family protein [Phycisphaeraceae bacterium]|nr:DUF89 family protein [Phycisphaeraceae bacterium]